MDLIKKYFWIIIIVITAGIAVLLRSTGSGHFRYDAAKWAEPSLNGSNLISPEKLSQLHGEVMILNMADKPLSPPVSKNQVAVTADSVLSKDMMKRISRNKGAVVIWSDDPAISARVWMVLSQTGIKDLYILSLDIQNEYLKEKFRTDTLIRPEL